VLLNDRPSAGAIITNWNVATNQSAARRPTTGDDNTDNGQSRSIAPSSARRGL